MPDNIARTRAAKPQHRRGDPFGPASTTDGNVLGDFGIRLLIAVDDIAGDRGVDQARIDGVHTDALPDVFKCSRPRQTDHAMLGSDIGADAGIAGQGADGSVVDDRAAALLRHLP
jgi:hypothetical protein